MRFYNDSGLDSEIHAKFYDNFEEGTWENSDILLCGTEELKNIPKNNIRYYVCNMTNTDHITVPPGVKMINLQGSDLYWVRSTAEHTMFLILSLVKKKYRGSEYGKVLAGKSLGIIGYGRVGKQVEAIAEAFDMDVHVVDHPRLDDEYRVHRNFVLGSDFISIHASVGPNGGPIFGDSELNLVKDGAYIINTARPCLVDEVAIIKHSYRLGGYASDFEVNNALRFNSKVIFTEHTGGWTLEDLKRTSEICFNKLMEDINDINA